mmetsp:Transcript_139/g.322  ORF Transcript_139/g.322 Transcript_139/m.322 type:complete len:266 (-) Transcript_139:30-827(-)
MPILRCRCPPSAPCATSTFAASASTSAEEAEAPTRRPRRRPTGRRRRVAGPGGNASTGAAAAASGRRTTRVRRRRATLALPADWAMQTTMAELASGTAATVPTTTRRTFPQDGQGREDWSTSSAWAEATACATHRSCRLLATRRSCRLVRLCRLLWPWARVGCVFDGALRTGRDHDGRAAPREGCVEGGGSYSMRHVSVLDRPCGGVSLVRAGRAMCCRPLTGVRASPAICDVPRCVTVFSMIVFRVSLRRAVLSTDLCAHCVAA